jgi:hypothetical protein
MSTGKQPFRQYSYVQGESHVGVSWGDIEWLNTRVIILGNNRELLSFACCLKIGKRNKIAFSGFFMVSLPDN